MLATATEFADGVREVRAGLLDVLGDQPDSVWARATRLPGWSVQDVLSHVTAGVGMQLGEPLPDHTPPELPHIRNEVGAFMEIAVDFRRSQPGRAVLDEFATKSARLADQFDAGIDLDEPIPGPMGSRPPRGAFTAIALFDWWIHEQDIRAALDRPGHLDGAVADHARSRILFGCEQNLPNRVPEISVQGIAIDLDGLRTVIGGGGEPELELSMPLPVAVALVAGRGDIDAARRAVAVKGDEDAAQAVLDALAFVP